MLFDSVNASAVAARIVEARQRRGESGSKLFHANSFHAHATGHIFAFHHGGRWEPQFNIGWFSSPPFDASACGSAWASILPGRARPRSRRRPGARPGILRAISADARQGVGPRARALDGRQCGIHPVRRSPAGARPPAGPRPSSGCVNCRNAAALEWIFVGRWLFLDKPADAKILADRAKLATTVDDTFRTLYPIWLATYR